MSSMTASQTNCRPRAAVQNRRDETADLRDQGRSSRLRPKTSSTSKSDLTTSYASAKAKRRKETEEREVPHERTQPSRVLRNFQTSAKYQAARSQRRIRKQRVLTVTVPKVEKGRGEAQSAKVK
ncbi:Hypothetical_protein [Hexamita inflata]|uniref:Hypothetical_protein n=1 Tax=Hexamita inflata TaxID=28002 RepID=A0AA86VFH0_9EUKA|nr:Hypothetical protein HINF_LOCUS52878 [Hexamita inflata]